MTWGLSGFEVREQPAPGFGNLFDVVAQRIGRREALQQALAREVDHHQQVDGIVPAVDRIHARGIRRLGFRSGTAADAWVVSLDGESPGSSEVAYQAWRERHRACSHQRQH